MDFKTPESMGQLAALVHDAIVNLRRQRALLHGEAGRASAKLVEDAHVFAGEDSAAGRGDTVYGDLAKAAEALHAAESAMLSVGVAVTRASRAVQEREARDKAKLADAAKYRV